MLNFIARLIFPISLVVVSLAYFIALIILPTGKKEGKIRSTLFGGRAYVAAEFVFLTIFTVVSILTLFFSNYQIGVNSPMGLVVNTYGNQTQWVVNLGGQKVSNVAQYMGGIQVPIYVIVLSFLGAYVYFLNKVPSLVKLGQEELEDQGLQYLVRFFIAPLLAVALYLVLWQLDVTGTFILGAVSFATGLIIEEVTERILQFAKDTIGTKEKTEKPIKSN